MRISRYLRHSWQDNRSDWHSAHAWEDRSDLGSLLEDLAIEEAFLEFPGPMDNGNQHAGNLLLIRRALQGYRCNLCGMLLTDSQKNTGRHPECSPVQTLLMNAEEHYQRSYRDV